MSIINYAKSIWSSTLGAKCAKPKAGRAPKQRRYTTRATSEESDAAAQRMMSQPGYRYAHAVIMAGYMEEQMMGSVPSGRGSVSI